MTNPLAQPKALSRQHRQLEHDTRHWAIYIGVVTAMLTNPIWVVKVRMITQPQNPDYRSIACKKPVPWSFVLLGHAKFGAWNLSLYALWHSDIGAFKTIFATEGLQGFYRGMVPAIFGVGHGSIQYVLYEQLKKYHKHRNNDSKLGTMQYLWMAALSKLAASLTTYPYQVVKSRLQVHLREHWLRNRC